MGPIAPIAAKISTAASVGIATLPTTPAKAMRMTSIQMPDQIAAQRVRAPAATLRAVCPTDRRPAGRGTGRRPGCPPLGRGSRGSCSTAGRRRWGGFAHPGALHQHDDRDGERVDDQVERDQAEIGQCGERNLPGDGALSSTRATLSAPAITTASVGTINATSAPTIFHRVLASPNRMASAASPVSSDARLMLRGWVMTSKAFAMAFAPVQRRRSGRRVGRR